MPKFPFLKFFPNDWLAEPTIRVCSVAARGLWMDMLSLMHLSPRRGYLLAATGSPMSPEQLARLTGCSADEVTRLLAELQSSGACSCTDDGTIYSRRMVREEGKREKCSDAGRKGGGNPTFKGQPKGGGKGDHKGGDKPLEARSKILDPPNPPPGGEGVGAGDEDVAPPDTVGPNPRRVVKHWNAQAGLLPATLTDAHRDRMIRSWATTNALWVARWEAAISFMGRTPHYCGTGGLNWKADLGWLFERSNFSKVIERMDAEDAPPVKLPFVPKIHRAADIPFVDPPTEGPDAIAG